MDGLAAFEPVSRRRSLAALINKPGVSASINPDIPTSERRGREEYSWGLEGRPFLGPGALRGGEGQWVNEEGGKAGNDSGWMWVVNEESESCNGGVGVGVAGD